MPTALAPAAVPLSATPLAAPFAEPIALPVIAVAPSVPIAFTDALVLLSIDCDPARPPARFVEPAGEAPPVAPLTAPLIVPASPPLALALPRRVSTDFIAEALPPPDIELVADWVSVPV